MLQQKKWKQSIKHNGKPLGEWLALNAVAEPTQDHRLSEAHADQAHSETSEHLHDHVGHVESDNESLSSNSTKSGTAHSCSCVHTNTQESDNETITSKGFTVAESELAYSIRSSSISDSQGTCSEADMAGSSVAQSYTLRFDQIFKDLESKLTESIKQLIDATFESIKTQLAKEVHQIMLQVQHLSTRMTQLEEKFTSSAAVDPPHCSPSVPIPIDVPKPNGVPISNAENLQKQVGELQKALERNEREKRDRNIIIVGLEESDENCEKLAESMIEEKLSLKVEDVKMSNVRRIGRRNMQRTYPRPVLVTFESAECKRIVMKKLAGSGIYLNNDLTKDQRTLEKNLREQRKFLSNHPDYKDKNILLTIYREKLWADRQQVSDVILKSLGFSQ